MRANQNEFCAADWADVIDPVLLAGKRRSLTSNARSRAVSRLIAENRKRFEELRAEENATMEATFDRRIRATARKVAGERGAA